MYWWWAVMSPLVQEEKNAGGCILGIGITELQLCSISKKHFQVSVLSSHLCCSILQSKFQRIEREMELFSKFFFEDYILFSLHRFIFHPKNSISCWGHRVIEKIMQEGTQTVVWSHHYWKQLYWCVRITSGFIYLFIYFFLKNDLIHIKQSLYIKLPLEPQITQKKCFIFLLFTLKELISVLIFWLHRETYFQRSEDESDSFLPHCLFSSREGRALACCLHKEVIWRLYQASEVF